MKLVNIILTLVFLTCVLVAPVKTLANEPEALAGKVSVNSGKLNIRKSANKSSKILKTIKKDKFITLVSKHGVWWKVKYNKTSYGFCHSDYIKIVSSDEKQVDTSYGNLNVRSKASVSSKIKDKLYDNEKVLVLSANGEFSKVLYHGIKTGFVSNKYLISITPNAPAQTYKTILLEIPDFKQTDSRWANVEIGSSGKTIGKIGCATTAIAMIESYRNEKNIYPDAMSKKLSYSSSGSVYWPSDYIVVTSSTNYLNNIYEILKQNKPVLIGAKKSNSSQHWVVIKGFDGGNTLNETNFLINDPGSKSRVTLKQFLNEYPYFYKYFYY